MEFFCIPLFALIRWNYMCSWKTDELKFRNEVFVLCQHELLESNKWCFRKTCDVIKSLRKQAVEIVIELLAYLRSYRLHNFKIQNSFNTFTGRALMNCVINVSVIHNVCKWLARNCFQNGCALKRNRLTLFSKIIWKTSNKSLCVFIASCTLRISVHTFVKSHFRFAWLTRIMCFL